MRQRYANFLICDDEVEVDDDDEEEEEEAEAVLGADVTSPPSTTSPGMSQDGQALSAIVTPSS